MNKTYYIFRHGQTFATKAGSGYGLKIFSAPILPEAIPPLENMAKYLRKVRESSNFSSPVRRCRETVDIIRKKTGKEFLFDERLREYFIFNRTSSNPLFIETFGTLRSRIQSFIDHTKQVEAKNILICTHGALIAGLANLLTNGEFVRTDVNEYPSPGILLIINDEKIKQLDFNTNK